MEIMLASRAMPIHKAAISQGDSNMRMLFSAFSGNYFAKGFVNASALAQFSLDLQQAAIAC
jgi:hypothetical protein